MNEILSTQCWRCKTSIEFSPAKRGLKIKCPSCGTRQEMPLGRSDDGHNDTQHEFWAPTPYRGVTTYICPRCRKPVERGGNRAAGLIGGIIGVLFSLAISPFQCENCGPIAISEFPRYVQRRIILRSVGLALSAVALLVVIILSHISRR